MSQLHRSRLDYGGAVTGRIARPAYTLLEVVLALSLTVVVMSAIGMAIHLHLRSVDTTRTSIERDQLARTLMRRIGDDVRSAVRREPFDDSGLQSLMGAAKNAASALGAAGGGAAGGSGAGNAGGSSSGSANMGATARTATTATTSTTGTTTTAASAQSLSGTDDSTATGEDATAGTPAVVAGLYGSPTELQMDIARVPRPDEFAEAMLAGGLPPSDVKTVYYFLTQSAVGLTTVGATTGLMRSEMNRATALFASENGDYQIFAQNAEPLAPEVVGLQFRYFDGFEWFTEWNSQARNGLPMAIEIALVIADPTSADQPLEAGALVDPTVDDVNPELVYHTVVQLPNAQIAASSTDTSQSSDSSSGQGTTGSGSGASGASGSSGQSSGGMTK
jgi:uncharacterized membrane protein YgcG